MCKGRGQIALDRQQAIEEDFLEEKHYFDDIEPWKCINDPSILGTTNLRRKLGDLQRQMIRDSIPGILVEIRQRLQNAYDTLARM